MLRVAGVTASRRPRAATCSSPSSSPSRMPTARSTGVSAAARSAPARIASWSAAKPASPSASRRRRPARAMGSSPPRSSHMPAPADAAAEASRPSRSRPSAAGLAATAGHSPTTCSAPMEMPRRLSSAITSEGVVSPMRNRFIESWTRRPGSSKASACTPRSPEAVSRIERASARAATRSKSKTITLNATRARRAPRQIAPALGWRPGPPRLRAALPERMSASVRPSPWP